MLPARCSCCRSASAAPALAATGDVVVTDRETVQIYMTPTGEVKVARLYDQVTATGKGTVDISNPVPTDGLRNLDGLKDLDVEDGNAVATLDVDGEERLRSVSTFDEDKLPVEITPTYTLDGKVYDDPEDIVGKSGKLEVKYKIENITGEPTTITVKDGKGNDVQRTVDVPLPLAGQLITVLPKEFYSVASDQATISADGRGATKMTFTMTLLPPVGSATAEIGYTAQVVDAVIPKASVTHRRRPAAEEPDAVHRGEELPGRCRDRRDPDRRRRGDRRQPAQAARRCRRPAGRSAPAPRRCAAAQRRSRRRGGSRVRTSWPTVPARRRSARALSPPD